MKGVCDRKQIRESKDIIQQLTLLKKVNHQNYVCPKEFLTARYMQIIS